CAWRPGGRASRAGRRGRRWWHGEAAGAASGFRSWASWHRSDGSVGEVDVITAPDFGEQGGWIFMTENDALYPSLSDRVTFITGGGSGIGESLVEHFCAQGAKVTFVDIARDPSEALVERIAARGHRRPRFVEADLRDVDRLQAI